MAGTGRGETRRTLLEAAAQVVREAGVTGLTLDAVARAAGVSKGGLLYHFPSKDALIAGLVEDRLGRYDEALEQAIAADPDQGPGRWLRAYIRLTFEPPAGDLNLTAPLLAAAGENPALLAPVWAAFARWQGRAVADGVDPVTATLIRLATDGLWFTDLFEAAPLDPDMRGRVGEALRILAQRAHG